MYRLDVHTHRLLAQDRIDSLPRPDRSIDPAAIPNGSSAEGRIRPPLLPIRRRLAL
jgi:hypothetical protein